MNITDIYETINSKTESFFEWVQAHPKIGLLFAAGLPSPISPDPARFPPHPNTRKAAKINTPARSHLLNL